MQAIIIAFFFKVDFSFASKFQSVFTDAAIGFSIRPPLLNFIID